MYVEVDNLREGTVTTTEVSVMWNGAISPSGCEPVLYYIVTAVSFIDPSNILTMVTRDNVAEFFNLRSDTSYNISAAAVNRAGTGPSSVITVTTLTLPGM